MAESAGHKSATNSLLDLCLIITDLFCCYEKQKRKVSVCHFQKLMMGSETIKIHSLYLSWNNSFVTNDFIFSNSVVFSAVQSQSQHAEGVGRVTPWTSHQFT